MLKFSRHFVTGAALVAGLGLLGTAHAQREGAKPETQPASQQAPPATSRPAPQPTPAAQPARPEESKPAAVRQVAPAAPAAAGDAMAERAEGIRKMAAEEARHRDRMAKLARLRELAQSKGLKDRLAALDALEKKESEVYESRRQRHRQQVGEDAFKRADDRLTVGRKRRVAAAKAAEGTRPAADQPTRPDAGTPNGERPKADAGAEHPKGERGANADKPDPSSRPDKPRSHS